MSADEAAEWIAFERVNGPLLAHERLEVMIATLCSLVANSHGAQTSPTDFIPWASKEQSPEEILGRMQFALATAKQVGR